MSHVFNDRGKFVAAFPKFKYFTVYLLRFFTPSTKMAPPTDAQQELWLSQYAMVPFNDLFSTSRLLLTDVDPLPEADAQGRRKAEGWRASWQGVVDAGESPSKNGGQR